MKFTIEKSIIAEALSKASKASAVRSTIAVLEGVLIHLKDNKVTVTGYDLETGIRCIVESFDSIEEGAVIINSKVFGDMIKKMPAGLVEITANDHKVTLHSGKVEYNIIGADADSYPTIPELKKDISFEIGESVIKSMIRQTIHAVALLDVKPVQMGVKFHIDKNILTTVACDGVRIARRDEPIEYRDIDFVVPRKALDELMKMLSDEPTESKVTISIDGNQICFSKNDCMIISRLLEGNFINYEKIMDFEEKNVAVINAIDFIAALDRTLALNTDKFKCPVVCVFESDNLHIDMRSSVGNMSEDMPIKYSGERFEVAFNARYMIDALKNSECDEIRLDFTGSLNPLRIRPVGDASYSAIVLPSRTRPTA